MKSVIFSLAAMAFLIGCANTQKPAGKMACCDGMMAKTPATMPTGQLYACPMHPEVTSTNPKDACPKCGMKINKPVKATTAPSTQPAGHSH